LGGPLNLLQIGECGEKRNHLTLGIGNKDSSSPGLRMGVESNWWKGSNADEVTISLSDW
jgi:hypothetical protein